MCNATTKKLLENTTGDANFFFFFNFQYVGGSDPFYKPRLMTTRHDRPRGNNTRIKKLTVLYRVADLMVNQKLTNEITFFYRMNKLISKIEREPHDSVIKKKKTFRLGRVYRILSIPPVHNCRYVQTNL